MARAIPDAALERRRLPSDWTLKQILAHVAHGNDFYTMVVNGARRSGFGTVRLLKDPDDYRAMMETDAAVMRCSNTADALNTFDKAFDRLTKTLDLLAPGDLVREIALTFEWRQPSLPELTDLKRRVVEASTAHMDEHREQISVNLAVLEGE